jgi:hypothetical protein
MKKWNLSVSDLGSWGVDALRLEKVRFNKRDRTSGTPYNYPRFSMF